jgi:hypothetical protein
MSSRWRLVLVIALAFVAFVLAATGHGRQLRKEREAHGYLQMDPVQGWPPAMHGIWQLDRARLGAGTAVAAVLGAGAALATGAGLGMAALAVLLWAPTLGFFVAGALSLVRLWAHDATAAMATLPAAALLFGLALIALVGSLVLGRVRRDAAAA